MIEAIAKRKSVRSFADNEVEPEKVESLLRAAMQAPSGMNGQPWDFVVVDDGVAPQWFLDGVEALLCAPTALNKQPYTVNGDGGLVSITAGEGHFACIDLGIGKYHFEVGAGKDNFRWN